MGTLIRAIPGHPGYYADEYGVIYSGWKRIRNKTGYGTHCIIEDGLFCPLSPRMDDDGYLQVSLRKTASKSNRRNPVHHLVLEAFGFIRPSPIHQTRHLNGIRHDNRLTNLKWGTPRENADDCIIHGSLYGEKNSASKITKDQASQILSIKAPLSALSKQFGLSKSSIWRIKRGQTWRHERMAI